MTGPDTLPPRALGPCTFSQVDHQRLWTATLGLHGQQGTAPALGLSYANAPTA